MKSTFVNRSRRRLLRFRSAVTTLVIFVGLAGAHAQARGGSVFASSAQPKSIMQTFVIIFRQGPHPLTEADKARRQAEISAWARVQNAAGHKLEPRSIGAGVRRPGSEKLGENGAGADAWPITALLFLEAVDLDDAAKVAESHPAHNYNVGVEVRPWVPPLVPAAAAPQG